MFLETSRDVLNFSLAGSVAAVAGFFCWMLYYLVAILRDARGMVSDVREKLNAIDDAIQSIRRKVESGFSSFGVVTGALKSVMSFVMEKRNESKHSWRDTEDEDASREAPPTQAPGSKRRKM